jgi:hypothetical protein
VTALFSRLADARGAAVDLIVSDGIGCEEAIIDGAANLANVGDLSVLEEDALHRALVEMVVAGYVLGIAVGQLVPKLSRPKLPRVAGKRKAHARRASGDGRP